MTKKSLPGWRVRALQDPNVTTRQANIIMQGPQSLSEAWFLGAMRLKYLTRGIND